MKRDECIFMEEEDCPKIGIGLSCDECIANKHYETIERAVNDFVSLGESFTAIFEMCNVLIKNNGSSVKLSIPVEDISKVHRVMTALLTTQEKLTAEEIIYRRLIFYFFSLIIDEFNDSEYTEEQLH